MKKKTYVQRNQKDTLFRMLFQEKENLLSLYNALNKTDYKDTSGLEITTLENAVYMHYKNDISFVFHFELMLYEHQSTVNPNMPLRDLFYVSSILQGMTKDNNLYGSRLIKLPSPRFVVFYNGTDYQPKRQTLKLSDAFTKKQAQPELELLITVYNINCGYNPELMEACHLLKEYAQYVKLVRDYAENLPFPEAVERAVDDCIKEGILTEFLLKNRAEAIAMSIFEYDEEKHIKCEREWAYEDGERKGLIEGEKVGLKKGERRLARLIQSLMDSGQQTEISRVLSDETYREQLYMEHHL